MEISKKEQLRKLLDEVIALDEYDEPTEKLTRAQEVLVKVNDLNINHEKNCNTDEVLLDAKIVAGSTKVCLDALDIVDMTIDSYNPDEFVENLIKYLNADDESETILNLDRLDSVLSDHCNTLPSWSYIYGTFNEEKWNKSIQPKVRKPRALLPQSSKKTQPDRIVAIDKEEHSVDETVKKMLSALSAACKSYSKPISYYHFVIDPDDFGKTVENIFHFSFLIRDGAVDVTVEEDMPFVKPVSRSAKHDHRNIEQENVQRIVSIDYNDWLTLKETSNIQSCLFTNFCHPR